MKRPIAIAIIVLLLSIWLASCGKTAGALPTASPVISTQPATSKPLTTPEPLATATANLQPNVTRGPWPTPRPSWTPHPRWTSSPMASITPAPVSVEIFQKEIPQCASGGSVKKWPDTETLSGSLLYERADEGGFFLADMTDLSNDVHLYQNLQINLISRIQFSPDGQWIAFLNDQHPGDEIVLDVFSSQGKKISTRWSPQELAAELQKSCGDCDVNAVVLSGAYFSWVNNHLLSITFYFKDAQSQDYHISEYVPRLLDRFTGIWVEPEWMSVSVQDMNPRNGYLSPNQEYILYEYSDYYHSAYIRLEAKDGRQLLDKYGLVMMLNRVSWTADSTKVLFGDVYDDSRLYISKLDEKPIQIVSEDFPRVGRAWALWSPDNHTLAVIIDRATTTIYLFDADTNQYRYSCPLEGQVLNLVWSPDGKWLLLYSRQELQSEIQIMNIETGQVYHFMDDAIPLGWSENYPVPEKP